MIINWDNLNLSSYSPYSGKHERSICVGKSGVVFPGIRIENASFPLTISASQVAVFTCLSEGDYPVELYVESGATDLMTTFLADYYGLIIKSTLETSIDGLFQSSIKPYDHIAEALKGLQKNAIAPESHFLVSCILVLENGNWVTGVNIEYPEWQVGLCAERIAISKAITAGVVDQIKEIHISASSGSFISPCGACRQVIVEHVPYKLVELHHPDGSLSTTTAAQLLPGFFDGSTLK
jgi:homotetrameric cytidine deaminase